MEKITILLVDDHRMVTNAIASMLNDDERFVVIGEATCIKEAIAFVTAMRPAIVLAEIRLDPELKFIDVMRKFSPSSRIISLTSYSIVAYARKFMRAGGMGVVTKNSSTVELRRAIAEVHEGKKFICNDIKDGLSRLAMEDDTDTIGKITQRELEVMTNLKNGLSSKEIADVMCVSTKTVEVHRYNILKKLKLRNVAELVNYINMQGL